MRDPLSWSIPLGRLFGINIRVHLLFPLAALVMILRVSTNPKPPLHPLPEGIWIDATLIMVFLFFSILLHEFGHCFGARAVNGDASEVLLWPLGGLAYCDVPHTPRANFICTAAGPAVNLILCLICGLLLFFFHSNSNEWQPLQPPWNPLVSYPYRSPAGNFDMTAWSGAEVSVGIYSWQALLYRFFWINWFLFLLNVVLIGYPLDGGRMFQAILWGYIGYRKATLAAVFAGFVTMCVVGIWAIVVNDLLPLLLAAFIYQACQHQWMLLETGGEESVFGYDFSQGYTSLEREKDDPPSVPQRKLSWWQRWLQRRAARKIQRELDDREADERRMDQLLEKISSQGMPSLTDEEKRFMKQFSDRYRNRNNS